MPPGRPGTAARGVRPWPLLSLCGRVGGLFGTGRLGGAGDLRGEQSLLHAGEMGGDPFDDGVGVARAVLRPRRQAVLGQRDQLGVGPAGVEPGRCVGQVAQRRLALDLAGRAGPGTPAGR